MRALVPECCVESRVWQGLMSFSSFQGSGDSLCTAASALLVGWIQRAVRSGCCQSHHSRLLAGGSCTTNASSCFFSHLLSGL